MEHLGNSERITTVNKEEVIFTTSDGQPLRMKVADLVEVIRQAMPTATKDKNGLMSKDGLISLRDLGQNDLKNVGNSTGYTYADGDGSRIAGPFLSVTGGVSCMQFKSNYVGSILKFRVYNQVEGLWSNWMQISFT